MRDITSLSEQRNELEQGRGGAGRMGLRDGMDLLKQEVKK